MLHRIIICRCKKEETQAKLTIEKTVAKPMPEVAAQMPQPKAGLSSLQKIRQKVAEQTKGDSNTKPLTEEDLYVAWGVLFSN
ncbi:MAG: hypothetical protein IPP48_07130 [Chitinophagaceae bacterium]|nr:hypothetical protein [Chitinophagaceae bacterium]